MCGRFMLFDEAQNEELRSIIDELNRQFIDKNNMPYTGFIIITTEPSPAISRIHNRMPVILSPESINTWLDKGDIGTNKKLLVPYPNTVISSIA